MPGQRSPRYPAFGLQTAVQYMRSIYDKERRTAVAPVVIGKALGYGRGSEKLSGPAASRIGSLRQYGLIERAAQGKLRVSDLALDLLLHGPDDDTFQAAARRAALTPPLFAELFGDYSEASPDAIRAHLIKSDFSEEAVTKIIAAFRETVAFAKLTGESYYVQNEETQIGNHPTPKPPEKRQDSAAQRRVGQEAAVSYSWPLGGGNRVELGFASEPTRAQLDIMLAQLKIMREVAPLEARAEAAEGEGE